MTTAQYPNADALRKGLDIYRAEMSEFIVRVLRQKPGSRLERTVIISLADQQRLAFANKMRENGNDVARSIEVGFIPNLVDRNWRDLFQYKFAKPSTVRNILWSVRDSRNELAHDTSGTDTDVAFAQSSLYQISEALNRINCPDQAKEVLRLRSQLGAIAGERTSQPPKAKQPPQPASAPTASDAPTPTSAPKRGTGSVRDLKAWREVMHPKADVDEGSFRDDDFAADLQKVYNGDAPAMYGDPLEFFRCTYITSGMRDLLVTAVKRVNGKGGNPIIQTKTGFGGGKTHSLIALYHLFNSSDELLQPDDSTQVAGIHNEILSIFSDAEVDPKQRASVEVCVLQGTWLSPTSEERTRTGDPLNTLWGEMGWQLGGQDGYDAVGRAARQGTAPGGEELDRLFSMVGPCVILMDEIVNYARNADIDTISSFFQNLTEAVNRRDDVVLIVTLPVSTTESGGERGVEALGILENLLNRVQAVAQVAQATNDEAFAVVRRRLFQEDFDEVARDATCRTFYQMYLRNAGDYPPEARETRYRDRLLQCYPIHPEIFDRLYEDWSLYHQFQRTRGVLRVMAHTINWLCANDDQSPLIMPGNLPFSEPRVNSEFVRLLGHQWDAVMGEVDRENSRTHRIDTGRPGRFGAVGGAARRAARAVFMGSATEKAVRGLTTRQINLAVVMPGHGAAVYTEAIQTMDGALYHFYRGNDGRYYFNSEENLNKVANDRAAELDNAAVDQEIMRRLSEFNHRSINRAVIACPQSPADIPDYDFVRLVILRPDQYRPSRAAEHDQASEAAQRMLELRGDGIRRTRPNTLLFLAASNDGIRQTRSHARNFLAWDSVINISANGDRRVANLSGTRLNQSKDQQAAANRDLNNALSNAYRWIMAPNQLDPQSAEYETNGWQQIAADADIADNALLQFVDNEELLDTLSPDALNQRLKEYLWDAPERRYHITVDELWDLLTHNIYIGLRLRNRAVLEQCLREGIRYGVFARADGYEPQSEIYRNLFHGIGESQAPYNAVPLTGSTLIVELEMAQMIEQEMARLQDEPSIVPDTPEPAPSPTPSPAPEPDPRPRMPRRFVARKTATQSDAASYDFNGTIRDEIARAMVSAGCEVTVEVTVTISNPDGIPENIARSLRDNSHMLGIDLEAADTSD